MILNIFISIFFLLPSIAHAYIGPGLGMGIILSTLGFLLALLGLIFGVIYFPIKKYLTNKRKKKKSD